MSDEEDIELVRRFNQTPGAKDLSVLDELLAEDFVAHSGYGQDVRGRDAWRQWVLAGQAQFGEVEMGIDEVLVNGNMVAERWWAKVDAGTRRGITMHRIENGKIQEDWVVWEDDFADGVTPPAATS